MHETPLTEVNEAAPTSLKQLIGQRGVVEQVAVALAAAVADNRPFDHALLVGPAGVGKTQTAKVIAQEIGGGFHDVLGQALETPADLNALLLEAKEKDVVFIDEAALIPSEQQHALLLALDQRKIVLAGGKTGKSPHSIRLSNFSLLLATTDEYRLIGPLIDRMRLVLRYRFYGKADLEEITRQRFRALNWNIDEDLPLEIAKRSRGVPRLALRLAQAARRVCRAEGQYIIRQHHLHRACALEQIDEIGLGPSEQQYLNVLARGACRLNVIASMLGLPARTVTQVVEPFLLRVKGGLVVKDDQGRRQLTAKGREHLLRIQAASVQVEDQS